jgi:hypothetical protein
MEAVTEIRVRELEIASEKGASELLAMARRDGYLFFRGLLPEEIVLPLRRRALEFAASAGWLEPSAPVEEARARAGKVVGCYDDPDWVNLQVHVQTSGLMRALGACEALHTAVRAADERGSSLRLSAANTVRVVSPHPEMATRPHQDAHYIRQLGGFWTAWVPLGDCPRQLGGLAVLPGSHRAGLYEHGPGESGVQVAEEPVWSATGYLCGDVLLFESHTLHRALPNLSGDRLRISADFRYNFPDGPASQRDVMPE